MIGRQACGTSISLHSLGDKLTRAAHFFGDVLLLGQTVAYLQYAFLIVHMHPGLEGERRNRRGVDVGQAPLRMVGKQMASTYLAPFAHAVWGLGVAADVLGALGDAHGVGAPEAEGIDGTGRPFAARAAMAVPH